MWRGAHSAGGFKGISPGYYTPKLAIAVLYHPKSRNFYLNPGKILVSHPVSICGI
jgi:hypothetical protein